MLHEVCRRFELLQAQRVRARRQLDGDEIELEVCVESRADFSAGLPLGPLRCRSVPRCVKADAKTGGASPAFAALRWQAQ